VERRCDQNSALPGKFSRSATCPSGQGFVSCNLDTAFSKTSVAGIELAGLGAAIRAAANALKLNSDAKPERLFVLRPTKGLYVKYLTVEDRGTRYVRVDYLQNATKANAEQLARQYVAERNGIYAGTLDFTNIESHEDYSRITNMYGTIPVQIRNTKSFSRWGEYLQFENPTYGVQDAPFADEIYAYIAIHDADPNQAPHTHPVYPRIPNTEPDNDQWIYSNLARGDDSVLDHYYYPPPSTAATWEDEVILAEAEGDQAEGGYTI